jgi:signal transduction histidine kinase/CheY-like chemotaxis protein
VVPRPISKRRFKPLDIALAILLAGWVPSILMAVVAYTILAKTLDSKIIVDRRTLVGTLAQLIGQELARTRETMEYYQKLPEAQKVLERRPFAPPLQDWIARVYYSQPRIDGLFVADAAGNLLGSVPAVPAALGRRYVGEEWMKEANKVRGAYLSPVFKRQSDGRPVAAIIVTVRGQNDEIDGYLCANILVQRLGEQLRTLQFGEGSTAQVIDQTGLRLFAKDFTADVHPEDPALHDLRAGAPEGHFQHQENLSSFQAIPGTGWTATLEQPVAIAYRPVHELLTKTTVLAGWLLVGTAVVALLISRLYRGQIEADERLARETFITQSILENMPIGIALLDPVAEKFVQANEPFADFAQRFGGLPEDRPITGAAFSDLHLGVEEMLQHVRQSSTPIQTHERAALGPDGTEHFLTINLLRLQDAAQTTQGILFLIEDHTVDISLRRELIAANTAKDQFLAKLSHELRNPLSPVITMVAELERLADSSPEILGPLEVIRRNVELEARLIDDLLDITRITHGKLQLTPEITDAHQVVERALEISHKDIAAKNITVQMQLEADQHHVQADPARLQQVAWNLIKNAVKFTGPGGQITITTSNRDRDFVLAVKDSGLGIAPDRLEKIFRAFEQGESSITRRFGGLGLGLAISRAMMRAHHGSLTAHSDGEGCGATFRATLATVEAPPPVAPEPVPEPDQQPIDARPRAPRRILIVEDHEDTSHGMKLLLTRRGYDVSIAPNVADALALVRAEKFDLLLSDLGLPDGTGYELMEAVRDTGLRGVALSGFGMEEDLAKSQAAGFSEHLIKPVNIERLDALLAKFFSSPGNGAM